ncbi:DEAD/DEAH box helicase [Nocardioides perillae]|uniref:ATP-dependent DNA helicase RecG n=1 Tax=Nocardioides perillae TaxID=1119534 RepID=A0A7Y9RX73_9ACTN|nr:ATP-dependent DNA helicase RecG [Nocardioides perillae]
MIGLDSPVVAVLGPRGPKIAKAMERLGVRTVGDLLHHHPRRYLAVAELTRLEELEEGQVLTVVGEVAGTQRHQYTDRRTGRTAYRVEARLRTDGPSLTMTFFAKAKHVSDWHERRLQRGRRGLFTGQAKVFRDQWQLTNPRMLLFGEDGVGPGGPGGADDVGADEADARFLTEQLRSLYPIYPLTKGLDSWDVQRAVAFALTLVDDVPDLLPAEVRARHGLPDTLTALQWLHLPDSRDQVGEAHRLFRFEEGLVTQLVLGRRRRVQAAQGTVARPGRAEGEGLLGAFDARLPFELTAGQREVGEVLADELARPRPMHRLLQGEVGSGKTLVALRAALRVVDSGGQVALLAPTEVLAQQHHRSITALLGDLAGGGMLGGAAEATRVVLLTGSMPRAARKEALLAAASGEAGLVIGTHALLEPEVTFADLGLVVVDEQHRFGVEQRAAAAAKATTPPHVLVMTATPIPRTVAMTVFGDLEVATLRELPAGRAPVQTSLVPVTERPVWLDRVWARVREEVEAGHQAYVVCPRIDADDPEEGTVDQVDLDAEGNPLPPAHRLASVEEVATDLETGPLAGLRTARLHGRLSPEVKDATMRAFAAGEVDVLVSTTVVEVGVDVANATTMVLLDADRFGVSQLHQLRGRVGRGGLPGLCLLVTHVPPGSPALERLEAVAATTDGFELSRLDLEHRREGDVLGAHQAGGRSSLQRLRVLRDEETIVAAREEAERLLDLDASLDAAPRLAEAVLVLEASVESDFLDKS